MGEREQAQIQFLGAAETVTGSKTLFEYKGKRVLIDCGQFQGSRSIRERNWQPFPVDPKSIDVVLLTHAHVDHCGHLPRLIKEGFQGEVLCSAGTRDLAEIILRDSAHLQVEEASYRNRHKKTRHSPALPLFNADDAETAISRLRVVKNYEWIDLFPDEKTVSVSAKFLRAGHILGSSIIQLSFALNHKSQILTFSGDLGHSRSKVIKGPDQIAETDYLVLESTYGDRIERNENLLSELKTIVNRVMDRGGVLLIPSFTVGRTQEVLHQLKVLQDEGEIGDIPVYVDSPMALNATKIYGQHSDELKSYIDEDRLYHSLTTLKYFPVRTITESQELGKKDGPMVIISAAGMLTGGRILYHLKDRLPDSNNALLFVGYQAEETLGRVLQSGVKQVRIHKEEVAVNAEVITIRGFSAHADQQDLIEWVGGLKRFPKRIFLNHGEVKALEGLRDALSAQIENLNSDKLTETIRIGKQEEIHKIE